jgi:hypothetical protein
VQEKVQRGPVNNDILHISDRHIRDQRFLSLFHIVQVFAKCFFGKACSDKGYDHHYNARDPTCLHIA